AGAGGSVFERVEQADLLLTGEMRHHSILAAAANGLSVVVTDHTNTERGYLPQLADMLRRRLGDIQISIAKSDRDPLVID
ncbi:MAG: Nif3-like dinuclear metal center hexameric protein, partial [Myxococcales bacterium]